MGMAEATVMDMLARMMRMPVPQALLDATEFPHRCRDTPGSKENAADRVPEDSEVDPSDHVEAWSLKGEHPDQDLE